MSSVFDPGKDDRDKASKKADDAVIKGGSFSGPGGIGGGFNFKDGVASGNMELGTFQSSMDGFQALTQKGFNQAGQGLPPELQALGQQTIGKIGAGSVNRFQNQAGFEGLGQMFQKSLQTANADPFELGSAVSEKLRALSERSNARNAQKMFDRLNASGKLGTSAGIAGMGEFAAIEAEQGMKFDLAGLTAGQSLQQDAFQRAIGASQGQEAIGSRQFGEEMGVNQYNDQAAIQQFGVGSEMLQMLHQNQQAGLNMSAVANSNAMDVSQLPLVFQAAMQNASIASSNSLLSSAGIDQQNAAMAKSPVMEAMQMAGGLASSMSGAGLLGKTISTNAGLAAGTNA